MRKEQRLLGLALALCLALAAAVQAQTNTSTWKEAGLELRMYDIKAFFTRTPIYNFANVPGTDENAMRIMNMQGGGGAGNLFTAPEKSDPNYSADASAKADRLKELIEHMVRAKEAWESAGGRSTIGFLTERGLMFISTTEDGHQQIEALLKQVLPGDKKNVAVDLQVVELDRAALGDVPLAGFIAKTDKDKAALKKAIKQVHNSTSLTGTDGQVLSNEKGLLAAYLTASTPVVTDNTVAWQPSITMLADGLAVQVQAALSSDATKATFDFRLANTRVLGMRSAKSTGTTREQAAETTVELPKKVTDLQAGTVILPLNCPAIVAGGTVPTALLTGKEADTGTTEIFYIATVRSHAAEEKHYR